MEERFLYFDCLSGISGDMTIGALLDLGVNKEEFIKELNKLNLDGYEIQIKKGKKNGITGTDFKVIIKNDEESNHVHRNLHDINNIIDNSQLNENVKKLSKEIFKIVANAEAKIHDKEIDNIHFHEVGAVDSIVDIVGTAICIDKLNIDKVYASPLHIGTGFVNCAHGNIPVPAPATLEILKDIPVYSKGIKSELVTPTGAAIVKALSEKFIPIPDMTLDEIGYGLGKKDLEIANVLRVIIGKKKLKKV
nr:nickel pincer cofactor biosynthesis protein LarC [Thermohalobacter berrensis]